MKTQSPKTLSFLILMLGVVLAIDLIFLLVNRRRSHEIRHKPWIFLNLLFPLLSYLVFTDQQDEFYIWASKVTNFIANGHLGVTLYDGKYGESSVSVMQFLLSAIIKFLTPLTVEQALFLPNVLAAAILTLVWHKYASSELLSRKLLLAPIAFLLLDYGFILCLASSFDVALSILFCLVVLIASLRKRTWTTYSFAIWIGYAEWVRSELVVFKIIYLIFLFLVLRRKEVERKAFMGLMTLTLAPTLLLVGYKWWAFRSLIPAMAYYKRPQLDIMIFVRSSYYLFQSLGVFALLATFVLVIIESRRPLHVSRIKIWTSLFPTRFRPQYHLSLIAISLLYLTPFLAGADYYGPKFQRYILTPIFLTLVVLCVQLHERSAKDSSQMESIDMDRVSRRLSSMGILVIMIVAVNSFVIGNIQGDGFSTTTRLNRASCDQILGGKIAKFWKGVSNNPLIIATSEANGIAFASGGRLLDLSGIVDSRNYPAVYQPISAGNMYGKFRFGDKVAIARPSILWPSKSEHCTFFNPLPTSALVSTPDLLTETYNSAWAKYWFPPRNAIEKMGYCPKQILTQDKVGGAVVAAFYFRCSR